MTFSKYPKISRVITFKIHCVVMLYFYLINSTLPTRDYLFSYISLSRERLAVLKLEMMIKKRAPSFCFDPAWTQQRYLCWW